MKLPDQKRAASASASAGERYVANASERHVAREVPTPLDVFAVGTDDIIASDVLRYFPVVAKHRSGKPCSHETGVPWARKSLLTVSTSVGRRSYADGPEMPASLARTIASARVRTSSLLKMAETWLRTVFSLFANAPAIALLSRPRARSARTSCSLG